ncbi:IS4 family transposase [Peribacillus deserti]|nr:IS4 family transposase [Peribacillus deserti]
MNKTSFHDEFQILSKTLSHIFSAEYLEQTARDTGFVQREGKLKAKDFLSLCTFLGDHSGQKTLNQLCSTLDSYRDINLSAEGLNQRFNEGAVAFIKKVFTDSLSRQIGECLGFSHAFDQYFDRIRILDSSGFRLPDTCHGHYKGSSEPGVKIQLEYELLKGNFIHLEVQDGRESDQTYGHAVVNTVEPRDLCLRDLGYFSFKDLERIKVKGAYYISRLHEKSAIYVKKDEGNTSKLTRKPVYVRVDLEKIMDQMKFGEMFEMEEVYVGYDQKFPTRLILCKLTEDQTKQRLLMREKKEKKKGVKYSHQTKRLSALNIYITNIPEEFITKQEVHELYSLRWQIEILFKTWKSLFNIHRMKKMKPERVECHLYGTLLSLLVASMITFQIRFILYHKRGKETSEFKGMSIVKEYFTKLHYAIFDRSSPIPSVITSIYRSIEKNGQKCHRYRKKTVFDILGIEYKKNCRYAS